MKLLVFSDSHGYTPPILKAIADHGGKADAIIHLGDGTIDAEDIHKKYPDIPACFISGNYEEYSASVYDDYQLRLECMLDFDGKKFFLCHGHRFGVKYSYEKLSKYAIAKGADIVLFGHTHTPEDLTYYPENTEGTSIRLFNPGSIGPVYRQTYGVINIANGVIITSHGEI